MCLLNQEHEKANHKTMRLFVECRIDQRTYCHSADKKVKSHKFGIKLEPQNKTRQVNLDRHKIQEKVQRGWPGTEGETKVHIIPCDTRLTMIKTNIRNSQLQKELFAIKTSYFNNSISVNL